MEQQHLAEWAFGLRRKEPSDTWPEWSECPLRISSRWVLKWSNWERAWAFWKQLLWKTLVTGVVKCSQNIAWHANPFQCKWSIDKKKFVKRDRSWGQVVKLGASWLLREDSCSRSLGLGRNLRGVTIHSQLRTERTVTTHQRYSSAFYAGRINTQLLHNNQQNESNLESTNLDLRIPSPGSCMTLGEPSHCASLTSPPKWR